MDEIVTQLYCRACGAFRERTETWCACLEAQALRARLGRALEGIDNIVRGGPEWDGSKEEIKRLNTMKTQVHISKGATRD